MKLWLIAGVFTLVAIPWASASEAAVECGLDTRQVMREEVASSVEAPQVTRKAARPVRAETATAVAPAASVGQRAAPPADQRRRGGSLRRIPDAMLIDGRGVL